MRYRKLVHIIFIVFLGLPVYSNAQLYTGGNGNGTTSSGIIAANLTTGDSLYNGDTGNGFAYINIPVITLSITDSLFNGGNGNGFSKTNIAAIALSINDSLYNGGNGNGFWYQVLPGASLSIIDSLYNGGNGNGFTRITYSGVALFATDSLYNGGIGRGEIQVHKDTVDLSLGCGTTNVVRWNGNEDNNWTNPANWDCGIAPDINSDVIIPSGRPRYPFLDNFWVEIRSLHMHPGSSLTIPIEARLIINGE